MVKKISIVGAGNVGFNAALKIAEANLAREVLLVDVKDGLARGRALDAAEAAPLTGFRGKISGSENIRDIASSDLVVITAGFPRTPGMTRRDLLGKNASIVGGIAREIKENSPRAIVINVTNPLDEMSYLVYALTGFPPSRVLGMAGVLDSARLRYFIAEKLRLVPGEVKAMVLGGHGESMAPLISSATAGERKVSEMLSPPELEEIVARTRKAGAEIVSLLKNGSAFYAPAVSVCAMIRAITQDRGEILPVSVYLEGQYGYKGFFLGVPARLGAKGVEEIIELNLSREEKEALRRSAEITGRGAEEVKALLSGKS